MSQGWGLRLYDDHSIKGYAKGCSNPETIYRPTYLELNILIKEFHSFWRFRKFKAKIIFVLNLLQTLCKLFFDKLQ